MTIKVYGTPGYTGTDRVLTTLYEKGVTDYEIVKVDLFKEDHKKPEFLKLQPFGLVPAFQDGDLTLIESRAIARYISHKFEGEGTALYGTNPKERALTESWLEVESHNYHPLVHAIVEEIHVKPFYGEQPDEAVVAVNVEKLKKVLDIYEAHLVNNKYLAGDFFSLADLSHLPYTWYMLNGTKLEHLYTERPHVKAWWEDISSRPAWKKANDEAAPGLK